MKRRATIDMWLTGTGVTHIMFIDNNNCHNDERWSDRPRGVTLTLAEAQQWTAAEFSTDFGGQDVPDFNAWSPTHVYFVHEYDGSAWLESALRNPPL